MAEIKNEIKELKGDEEYLATCGECVVTEDHTIADIVRLALWYTQGDKAEIQFILDGEDD